MATNDIVSIVATWQFASNVIQNQFIYKLNGGSATAVFLVGQFIEDIIPLMQPLITEEQDLVQVVGINVNNPLDFTSVAPPSISGTATGESAPSMNAIRFFNPTENRSIRQGRKQIGVTALSFFEGSFVNYTGAFATAIDALRTGLGNSLLAASGGHTASPIIVKRTKTLSPSGKPVYSLPPVATSENYFIADSWALDDLISTQNTRKLGRGA